MLSYRPPTLVEWLVIIATMGIFAAIILPGIGHSNGSSRRDSCTHNMRQLAVSELLYISNKEKFSPLRKQYSTPRGEVYSGWFHEIAQYLDQGLGDQLHTEIKAGNPQSVRATFNVLICPSDDSINSDTVEGKISYLVNGGCVNDYNTPYTDVVANGVFMDQITSLGQRTYTPQKIYPSDIADGASNTLMILETLDADVWYRLADINLTPQTAAKNELRNCVIWLPNIRQATRTPLLCNPQAGRKPFDGSSATLAHPSSRHNNCFVAAMCDGSTHTIDAYIDYKVYAQLMSSNGSKAYPPGIAPPDAGERPQPDWQGTLQLKDEEW